MKKFRLPSCRRSRSAPDSKRPPSSPRAHRRVLWAETARDETSAGSESTSRLLCSHLDLLWTGSARLKVLGSVTRSVHARRTNWPSCCIVARVERTRNVCTEVVLLGLGRRSWFGCRRERALAGRLEWGRREGRGGWSLGGMGGDGDGAVCAAYTVALLLLLQLSFMIRSSRALSCLPVARVLQVEAWIVHQS